MVSVLCRSSGWSADLEIVGRVEEAGALMGYDLRTTRAAGSWAESKSDGIPAEEWLGVIADRPELSLEEGGKDLARRRGPSMHPDPWFDWSKGTIETKIPDRPIVKKMLQIGARLSARVQG
jgi:hypothetical protein